MIVCLLFYWHIFEKQYPVIQDQQFVIHWGLGKEQRKLTAAYEGIEVDISNGDEFFFVTLLDQMRVSNW